MVQTNWVKEELEKAHPLVSISIEAMATKGDKILDVALAKIGDKGLFTKELEAQMLVGRADRLHSSKPGVLVNRVIGRLLIMVFFRVQLIVSN